MSFQNQFRRLPSSKQKSILKVFRQWTTNNERHAALIIHQLFWEHFLRKTNTQMVLDWLESHTSKGIPSKLYELKHYLRHKHKLVGGILRCDHPIHVGTVISWERFQGYLRDFHGNEFDGEDGIKSFINGLEKNHLKLPAHLANIPFRKANRLSWFFWDAPGYEDLVAQPKYDRQKDFYVKHLGLNLEEFAINKLLLFIFDLKDVVYSDFHLHRPTIGDAACNPNFLPPRKAEYRFGMTVPSTEPKHAWTQTAGPIWRLHPDRTRPEAVGNSDQLKLKHIVEFQILD